MKFWALRNQKGLVNRTICWVELQVSHEHWLLQALKQQVKWALFVLFCFYYSFTSEGIDARKSVFSKSKQRNKRKDLNATVWFQRSQHRSPIFSKDTVTAQSLLRTWNSAKYHVVSVFLCWGPGYTCGDQRYTWSSSITLTSVFKSVSLTEPEAH